MINNDDMLLHDQQCLQHVDMNSGLIAGLSSKKHLAGTLWNVIKSGTNAQAIQGRVETTEDTAERAEYEQLLAGMMMDHVIAL